MNCISAFQRYGVYGKLSRAKYRPSQAKPSRRERKREIQTLTKSGEAED